MFRYIEKLNKMIEEADNYKLYQIDDDVMGLNDVEHQNHTSWYTSKYQKKFLQSIGSNKIGIGVLSYNHGGSYPVWITAFKIPKEDDGNKDECIASAVLAA